MITKNINLKAYCKQCLNLVFHRCVAVEMRQIEDLPMVNNKLRLLIPDDLKCDQCHCKNVQRSYTYVHEHKFIEPVKNIERCKSQLKAIDDNAIEMTPKDKRILKDSFLSELDVLLTNNNMFLQ